MSFLTWKKLIGMRAKILFVILVCSYNAYCQNPIIGDSLIKYSYTLLGFSNSPKASSGTGFFIKNNNVLFLVTAQHTFYDCDTIHHKHSPRVKYGVVYIPSPFNVFQFSIPEKSDTCLGQERDLDLLVIKLGNSIPPGINTVEEYLLPPFKKLGSIEIFGQGIRNDSSFVGFDMQHHIPIPKKSFTIYHSIATSDKNYIDSLHYVIDLKRLKIDDWIKGFSGSPVFLQNRKSKKWRLCGVLIQALLPIGENHNSALLAIKPEYIMEEINKLRKKEN